MCRPCQGFQGTGLKIVGTPLDCWVKELLLETWDAGCQLLGLHNLGPFLATVDAMGDQNWSTAVHAFRSDYNL